MEKRNWRNSGVCHSHPRGAYRPTLARWPLWLLLTSAPCHANVNDDLNHFFGKLGFEGNVSTPEVWQGQAAGYASGGSLFLRSPVKQIQLVTLQMPSLNAGCGGIDAYLGSFSHISGEQLQRFVKQIMGNAAGYFFEVTQAQGIGKVPANTLGDDIARVIESFEGFSDQRHGELLDKIRGSLPEFSLNATEPFRFLY